MNWAELKECQMKFEQVLNAIHNPNFKLHNDVYFEMIITHLSGRYSQGKINNFDNSLFSRLNNSN